MPAIDRIKAALESDTPSRVEWRTQLETALFEIDQLTRDLAEASAEADRLKSYHETWQRTVPSWEAENARLREGAALHAEAAERFGAENERLRKTLDGARLVLSGLTLRRDGDKVARENAVARINSVLGIGEQRGPDAS